MAEHGAGVTVSPSQVSATVSSSGQPLPEGPSGTDVDVRVAEEWISEELPVELLEAICGVLDRRVETVGDEGDGSRIR